MPSTPLYPKKIVDRGKWNDYRDEIWGDSYNWSWVRPWGQLDSLVIHHSVTKHDATPDDIALLHKARGYAGIGYHFVITKDGMVYYVGDISTARAHIAGENERGLGIVLVGDFTKHLPSDAQITSAHELCEFFFFETPSIPTLNNWDQLKGHKDMPLSATACPGSSWPDDMRWRIQTGTVYTPPPTPVPPTPPVPPIPPVPPVDDLYRVMHKGEQLGAFSENPITKIEKLEEDNKKIKIEIKNQVILKVKDLERQVAEL